MKMQGEDERMVRAEAGNKSPCIFSSLLVLKRIIWTLHLIIYNLKSRDFIVMN
jgi:hypothetical protein